MSLSENQTKLHSRFQNEYPFFAKFSLKIRTKDGTISPLILNDAQTYLHKKLEDQLNATGKIRALILKGRQQGCSTYVGGRFYWRTTRNSGKATFILSHEADTTEKLFQMVERYHSNCPEPVKAQTDVANRRRMVFTGLNSEYFVGTAGNENVGRGGTVQYLHASEAAFYPDGEGFSKGLLQSVPDLPGTEIIIESTANGMDPLFYKMCMDALNHRGDYQLIFIPWYWQKEYRKKLPSDFQLTPEEDNLKQLYKLDDNQIFWRRNKIIELKSETAFMQEYPFTVEEAFIVSIDSLIPSIKIMEARKSIITDPGAALVMGVDPNEAAGRAAICFRRGREILRTQEFHGRKPMDFVRIVADLIDANNPVKCFIDTGNGYGVVDRLYELGYEKIVMGVSFNDGPIDEEQFLNKRCEMWCELANWFINGGVRCPDDDVFHKELTCVPQVKKTSSGLKKLESKDTIRQNTMISPDLADAAALTFAYPVRRDLDGKRSNIKKVNNGVSKLKSIARRNGMERTENYASKNLPIFSGRS